MMNKKKVTVPFFYTDPIAEKGIYPIKGIIWFSYFLFLALLFLFFISQYIQEKQFPTGLVFIMFFLVAFGYGVIALFARDIFEGIFFDHIEMEDNHLIYYGSKVFSGNKKSFQINLESKLIWSVEKSSKNAIENSLYIIDAESKKHILIGNVRLYVWKKSWDTFIDELSELSGLKIEKEIKNT